MARLINHCKSNGATNAMMKRAVSYGGGETIISVGQQSEIALYARIPARAQQTLEFRNRSTRPHGVLRCKRGATHVWRNLVVCGQHIVRRKGNGDYTRGIRYRELSLEASYFVKEKERRAGDILWVCETCVTYRKARTLTRW